MRGFWSILTLATFMGGGSCIPASGLAPIAAVTPAGCQNTDVQAFRKDCEAVWGAAKCSSYVLAKADCACAQSCADAGDGSPDAHCERAQGGGRPRCLVEASHCRAPERLVAVQRAGGSPRSLDVACRVECVSDGDCEGVPCRDALVYTCSGGTGDAVAHPACFFRPGRACVGPGLEPARAARARQQREPLQCVDQASPSL